MTAAMVRATSNSSVMSHARARQSVPLPASRLASAASASASLSRSASCAPEREKRSASAAPMPPAAPVTTTTLPRKSRCARIVVTGGMVRSRVDEKLECLTRGAARNVAELFLETGIVEDRPVAQEADLLGSILGKAEPMQHRERVTEEGCRQRDIRFVEQTCDLGQRERAVTGQVVDPASARMDGVKDRTDDVLIPHEHERCGRAAHSEHDGAIEHVGDLVVRIGAQDRAGPKDELNQLGMTLAPPFEHLLDEAFVVGVREFGVSTQRVVLAQQSGVVGVVAVRGAAARVDDLAHAGTGAAGQDVAGSGHVDGELELAGHAGRRRDDRREMDDELDAVAAKYFGEVRGTYVGLLVSHSGSAFALFRQANVEREDPCDRMTFRERGNDLPADVSGGSSHRD